MAQATNSRGVLVRDLLVFQLKLFVDGVKDVAIAQVALGAALLDLLLGGPQTGRLFYSVMRLSERFDLWLNLHRAARDARPGRDGLFGASEAGSDSMLGKLEELVRRAGFEDPLSKTA